MYTTATPAVTDGHGVLLESRKVAESVVVNTCEVAWADALGANMAVAADPLDFKVGANSMKFSLVVASAAGEVVGVAAAMNLSGYTHLEFWAKSSINLVAGAFTLVLGVTKGGTPVETLAIPALVAGVWKHCRVAFANPALITAAAATFLTLMYVTDQAAIHTLNLDDIRAVTLARSWEALKVDTFIEDDVYFALSEGIADDCKTDRVLLVNYAGPNEDPQCSN
jgi:hypothetical protein